ncbi:MAG: SDR family NAD(P)-dependent oxidoreductase, partial [Dehalococcoidia bacterium]
RTLMALEKTSLAGKVAIVTGGGRGLGKAMATSLAEAGAEVCIASRTKAQLQDAADEIRDISGKQALMLPTDITDSAQCSRMVVDTVSHFGRLDILINNAGIGDRAGAGKKFWEWTDEDWHATIDVNLSGTFYCSRAAAKVLIEQGDGGAIVNVSSGTSMRSATNSFGYATAKGGVISFTKSLSGILVGDGVRVNCIVPGFVSQSAARNAEEEQARTDRGRFITVRRLGQAWELGPLAVYLCSNASAYMTGEIFIIDGGGLAGGIAPTGYRPDQQPGNAPTGGAR